MDIFAYWRDQELKSTMQRLADDNARLRRASRISALVYWACLIGVVVLGLMKIYGG